MRALVNYRVVTMIQNHFPPISDNGSDLVNGIHSLLVTLIFFHALGFKLFLLDRKNLLHQGSVCHLIVLGSSEIPTHWEKQFIPKHPQSRHAFDHDPIWYEFGQSDWRIELQFIEEMGHKNFSMPLGYLFS